MSFLPTMVTHDLPGSLHADVLEIVVAALLVLLQGTALLVAPAAVVALVRFAHCKENSWLVCRRLHPRQERTFDNVERRSYRLLQFKSLPLPCSKSSKERKDFSETARSKADCTSVNVRNPDSDSCPDS